MSSIARSTVHNFIRDEGRDFMTDGSLFPSMNDVYRNYFNNPRLTRRPVVLAKLDGPGRIEIPATARK